MKKILPHLLGVMLTTAAAVCAEPEKPKRVLIIGDSMMRVTAHATERALTKIEGVQSRAFTSLGSGMARLDIFDWMAKIDELVAEFNPDTTIVWFGTNDRQALRTGANIIQTGDPAWEEEYARRVGLAMDKLTASPGARVLWLELPDMREAKISDDVNLINKIVKAEADKRPNVEFFPTRGLLSRQPGTYSPYVIGRDGMPLQIRDADGVHLNRAGADRMAEAMIKHLYGSDGR